MRHMPLISLPMAYSVDADLLYATKKIEQKEKIRFSIFYRNTE